MIIKGTTLKLFNRKSSYMNPNVILSYGNSTYMEDFILNLKNKEKVLVQPNLKTKPFNLDTSYLISNDSWFKKVWNFCFFKKIPVLKAYQEVLIYGKLTKNNLSTIKEYEKYVTIVPKFIDRSCESPSNFDNYRSLKILKVKLALFGVLFLTGALVSLFTSFYWLKIKNFFFKVRERKSIYCKICKERPCNILCEECDGLNEYCSICFKSLENYISDGRIQLSDIRCCNCSKELDKAQIIMYS